MSAPDDMTVTLATSTAVNEGGGRRPALRLLWVLEVLPAGLGPADRQSVQLIPKDAAPNTENCLLHLMLLFASHKRASNKAASSGRRRRLRQPEKSIPALRLESSYFHTQPDVPSDAAPGNVSLLLQL